MGFELLYSINGIVLVPASTSAHKAARYGTAVN